MMETVRLPELIRGIVFDLDGTLYVCDDFNTSIHREAEAFVAGYLGIEKDEAARRMAAERERLAEEDGAVPTLSAVCTAMGCDIRSLHGSFEGNLQPENMLERDQRVADLLRGLADRYVLALYTNNNRVLATRILAYLGLDRFFTHVVCIDDTWRPKPDQETLERLLTVMGLKPHEALFVGDRYDTDLRLPEQMGAQVYLSTSIGQLLRLGALSENPVPENEKETTEMSTPKEVLDSIMRAIELEKETFDFYTRSEHRTFNPGGKRIFRWLAKTEESHYLKLTELYNSLSEGGRWVFYGGAGFDLEPAADDENRVGFETDDADALKIALEIEKKGIACYDALIARADDADGRKMLEALRAEEVEHMRVISEKMAEIKAD